MGVASAPEVEVVLHGVVGLLEEDEAASLWEVPKVARKSLL